MTGCTGTFHLTKSNNEAVESSKTTSDVARASEDTNSAIVASCSLSNSNVYDKLTEGVYLRALPVLAEYENKTVITYAMLNQESTRSFFGKSLFHFLGASKRREK